MIVNVPFPDEFRLVHRKDGSYDLQARYPSKRWERWLTDVTPKWAEEYIQAVNKQAGKDYPLPLPLKEI